MTENATQPQNALKIARPRMVSKGSLLASRVFMTQMQANSNVE